MMMLYLTIQFIFLYFKIARVHNKEEKLNFLWKAQHSIVLIVALLTFIYAINHMSWYALILVSLFSLIISSMLITAIQLGIFVEGKPLFGMQIVYKNTGYLVALLCCSCAIFLITV